MILFTLGDKAPELVIDKEEEDEFAEDVRDTELPCLLLLELLLRDRVLFLSWCCVW